MKQSVKRTSTILISSILPTLAYYTRHQERHSNKFTIWFMRELFILIQLINQHQKIYLKTFRM